MLRPNLCRTLFYNLVPKPKDKAERERERGNELQFGNISGRKINSLLNAADFAAAVSRFSGPFLPTVSFLPSLSTLPCPHSSGVRTGLTPNYPRKPGRKQQHSVLLLVQEVGLKRITLLTALCSTLQSQ